MLVLSRKVGERICVGENVFVTVVRIGPNAVRLGIEAPKGMNIMREELTEKGPKDERTSGNERQAEAATGLAGERRIQANERDVEDPCCRAGCGDCQGRTAD